MRRYNNLDELYHSKSEEGLSRLLAFLREEEERERLEQIERMKPIGTQVLSPLLRSSWRQPRLAHARLSHAIFVELDMDACDLAQVP